MFHVDVWPFSDWYTVWYQKRHKREMAHLPCSKWGKTVSHTQKKVGLHLQNLLTNRHTYSNKMNHTPFPIAGIQAHDPLTCMVHRRRENEQRRVGMTRWNGTLELAPLKAALCQFIKGGDTRRAVVPQPHSLGQTRLTALSYWSEKEGKGRSFFVKLGRGESDEIGYNYKLSTPLSISLNLCTFQTSWIP